MMCRKSRMVITSAHLAGRIQRRIGAVVVRLDLGDAEHGVVASTGKLLEVLPAESVHG